MAGGGILYSSCARGAPPFPARRTSAPPAATARGARGDGTPSLGHHGDRADAAGASPTSPFCVVGSKPPTIGGSVWRLDAVRSAAVTSDRRRRLAVLAPRPRWPRATPPRETRASTPRLEHRQVKQPRAEELEALPPRPHIQLQRGGGAGADPHDPPLARGRSKARARHRQQDKAEVVEGHAAGGCVPREEPHPVLLVKRRGVRRVDRVPPIHVAGGQKGGRPARQQRNQRRVCPMCSGEDVAAPGRQTPAATKTRQPRPVSGPAVTSFSARDGPFFGTRRRTS